VWLPHPNDRCRPQGRGNPEKDFHEVTHGLPQHGDDAPPPPRLASGDLPRYLRPEWQERAVFNGIMRVPSLRDSRPGVVEAARAGLAIQFGAEVLALIKALGALARENRLPDLLVEMGHADRVLGPLNYGPGLNETLLSCLQPLAIQRNLPVLLRSPAFFKGLRYAVELVTQDRADKQVEVAQARQLLEAFIEVLSTRLKTKGLRPVVRSERAAGAAEFIETRLAEWIELIREMDAASEGYDDPEDILERLLVWRASYRARGGLVLRLDDPIDPESPLSASTVPCFACGGDRVGAAARALSIFRQERQNAGQRGPFPYREAAVAVFCHRCPNPISRSDAARELEKLEKRRNSAKRT